MKNKNKVRNCPCCGNMIDLTQKNMLDSKFMDTIKIISELEHDRFKEFQYIGKILEDIKSRIYGTAMGFVEETIILSELKTSCPYDRFSDELSSKHGTDIVSYVREGGIEIGKISLSVKRHKKWKSTFISQLEKNITSDNSKWGLLITTVFPKDALNQDIWTTYDQFGRLIMMVKPFFVGAAYYAVRQIVIYEHLLSDVMHQNFVLDSSSNFSLMTLQKNQQIFQKSGNQKL